MKIKLLSIGENPTETPIMSGRIIYIRVAITLLGGITLGSCSAQKNESPGSSIARLDAGLDSVIDPTAYVEIIGKGFNWSDGPLWVAQDNMLLFFDVLENKLGRAQVWTTVTNAHLVCRLRP